MPSGAADAKGSARTPDGVGEVPGMASGAADAGGSATKTPSASPGPSSGPGRYAESNLLHMTNRINNLKKKKDKTDEEKFLLHKLTQDRTIYKEAN